jgi:hypothetical protein
MKLSAYELMRKDYYQDWLKSTKVAREHPRRSAAARLGHTTRKARKQKRDVLLASYVRRCNS